VTVTAAARPADRATGARPRPCCRSCGSLLTQSFADLGMQPLANAYVDPGRAGEPDPLHPLHALVCGLCLLVQLDRSVDAETLFSDYPYFSSFSDSWLVHCEAYADAMTKRFQLGPGSRVVEVASNDGCLLQSFLARGIQVLGVEPAANVAAEARRRGVPTEIAFFGRETARRLAAGGGAADLVAANNVLAHLPDVDDFVAGLAVLLKPDGVFTAEFPHLLNLIRDVQFDTIYHEHCTYLSLLALLPIFERHGLPIFDVEAIPGHGGSLRIFAAPAGAGRGIGERVRAVLDEEIEAGLDRPEGYAGFQRRIDAVRDGLKAFLSEAKASGLTIVGYGAPAKGNVLLNHCGVTPADLPFVVDRNPAKQGKLLPGSRIPVRPVAALLDARPDLVLILPWNLRGEIVGQLPELASWGGRFVTAIPGIRVFSGAD
jgi:SAM-dependent methyltransferase